MKTACIYHSIDLDGWMSAAIVKHWFIENNKEHYIFDVNQMKPIKDTGEVKSKNILDFIGYNYGQPIPDLSEYDKVIMCDISFPKEEMLNLWATKGLNFIWIDHHISAIKDMKNAHENIYPGIYPIQGLRNTNFAACELTWNYFMSNSIRKFGEIDDQEPIPEIVRLLGLYDSFRHKNTDEEQKVLEFQYGARQCIKNYEEAYEKLMNNIHYNKASDKENLKDERIEIWNSGIAIYQYLCTEAKQVYKNGFEIKLVEEITDHIGKNIVNRRFICINKERFNPVNFGIDYHKDGYDGCACFHFNGTHWCFSLYNDNGKVDCSQIAKRYGGGGHKGAAGMIVDLETFKSIVQL